MAQAGKWLYVAHLPDELRRRRLKTCCGLRRAAEFGRRASGAGHRLAGGERGGELMGDRASARAKQYRAMRVIAGRLPRAPPEGAAGRRHAADLGPRA